MKKFIVKQRLISFGDDFDIRDDKGTRLYFVDGKALTFFETLSFKDMARNEHALIKRKPFTFAPCYKIMRRGMQVALIKKRLFTFRNQFIIDIPGPNDYRIVGNLMLYNYKIYRGSTMVAKVSKKIISVRDSYGVEINDNEDHILLLCACIVIDMVLHNPKK